VCKYFHFPQNTEKMFYNFVLEHYGTKQAINFGFGSIPLPDDNHVQAFIELFIDLGLRHIYPNRSFDNLGLWSEGSYEQFGLKVEKSDVVVDAGANIGIFSLYAASKGAKVYAFEPFPEAIRYLRRTLELNPKLAGKITVMPMALMDRTARVKLTYVVDHIVSASIVIARGAACQEIPAVALDELMENNKLPKVTFIKADVEGAERLVLDGAAMILKKYRPKLAICTYHLKDDPEIIKEKILTANPSYEIHQTKYKLFAY